MPSILTAIVLYRLQAEESASLRSFAGAMQERPELRDQYRLIVFDNSPEAQTLPPGYGEAYFHDATNPGLARPYSLALEWAERAGIPWLMVLDQDTSVTFGYLEEAAALAESLVERTDLVGLVPKLLQNGIVQSPHTLIGLRQTRPISIDQTGPAAQELHAFNSGAVLPVALLRNTGGFPLDYPLDFLDHATFRILQRGGGRLYLMASSLQHDLSLLEVYRQNLPEVPERMRRVFETEVRFYREMGTPEERILHRVRLLYRAAKSVRVGAYQRSLLFLKLAAGFKG